MRTIRLWLSYVLEPAFRLGFYILLRLMGHSRLRIGTSTFWGSPTFLATCESAVHRLRDLDCDLHAALTKKQKLIFYDSPKHLEQLSAFGYFSIDDSFTSWRTDGVIARLVYAARLAASGRPRVVTRAGRPADHALQAEVSATTGTWLAARSFPQPLVNCFREQTQ